MDKIRRVDPPPGPFNIYTLSPSAAPGTLFFCLHSQYLLGGVHLKLSSSFQCSESYQMLNISVLSHFDGRLRGSCQSQSPNMIAIDLCVAVELSMNGVLPEIHTYICYPAHQEGESFCPRRINGAEPPTLTCSKTS